MIKTILKPIIWILELPVSLVLAFFGFLLLQDGQIINGILVFILSTLWLIYERLQLIHEELMDKRK